MSFIVGTYAAHPANPDDLDAFIAPLASSPLIGGLEVPFTGGALAWPAAAARGWVAVATDIPGTVQRNATDPAFGLASADEDGRGRALAFAGELRDAVAALSARGTTVRAVELHSAPHRAGDPDALTRSLTELAGWDWSGAQLLIEHCDADSDTHVPEKGYLSLDAELAVLRRLADAGVPVGCGLNWGRSAIEGRSPDTALEHVRTAVASGLLRCLMFSGVSGEDTEFGPAWLDMHLPPAGMTGAPASSLLTRERIADARAAAGPAVGLVGFKMGLRPVELPAAERAARLLEIADLIFHHTPAW